MNCSIIQQHYSDLHPHDPIVHLQPQPAIVQQHSEAVFWRCVVLVQHSILSSLHSSSLFELQDCLHFDIPVPVVSVLIFGIP